jgi:hypothetical protein
MVKVAVKRRKHAAYIDAMLEGRASDKPPTTPERPDVDKKGSAPDS